VTDRGVFAGREEDVGRLHVAVHQPRLMDLLEAAENLVVEFRVWGLGV